VPTVAKISMDQQDQLCHTWSPEPICRALQIAIRTPYVALCLASRGAQVFSGRCHQPGLLTLTTPSPQ
jgi:hypothetical protein